MTREVPVVTLRTLQCLWLDADLCLSFGAFWSLGKVLIASPYPSKPREPGSSLLSVGLSPELVPEVRGSYGDNTRNSYYLQKYL